MLLSRKRDSTATRCTQGAKRGWSGRVTWCRGCRAHTCRCSRPARLEAGRAASSSPKIACMRCLGSRQAAGLLSGYPCRSLGALSPEVGAAHTRHGGRVRGAGRGGRRAWLSSWRANRESECMLPRSLPATQSATLPKKWRGIFTQRGHRTRFAAASITLGRGYSRIRNSTSPFFKAVSKQV